MVGAVGGEITADQVGRRHGCLVGSGQTPATPDMACYQALAGHRRGDGLFGDLLAVGPQPSAYSGGTVGAPRGLEHDPDLEVQLFAAAFGGSGLAVAPLIEPRLADTQQSTGHGVGNSMVGPLGGDMRYHAHRVASLTHRTTDRLSTSRSIRNSATSFRNRINSARLSSSSCP